MKSILKTTLIALFFATLTAQSSTAFTATAEVKNVLTLNDSRELSFGEFAPGIIDGEVTIEASDVGIRAVTNVTEFSTNEGTSAQFDAAGGSGTERYYVYLPVDGAVTLNDGLGNLLNVKSFQTNLVSDEGDLVGGASTFYVGATIEVPSTTPLGIYSGNYDVIALFE